MPKFTFWPLGKKPEEQDYEQEDYLFHCYRCGLTSGKFTEYEIDGGEVILCDTCYSRERG